MSQACSQARLAPKAHILRRSMALPVCPFIHMPCLPLPGLAAMPPVPVRVSAMLLPVPPAPLYADAHVACVCPLPAPTPPTSSLPEGVPPRWRCPVGTKLPPSRLCQCPSLCPTSPPCLAVPCRPPCRGLRPHHPPQPSSQLGKGSHGATEMVLGSSRGFCRDGHDECVFDLVCVCVCVAGGAGGGTTRMWRGVGNRNHKTPSTTPGAPTTGPR